MTIAERIKTLVSNAQATGAAWLGLSFYQVLADDLVITLMDFNFSGNAITLTMKVRVDGDERECDYGTSTDLDAMITYAQNMAIDADTMETARMYWN